MMKGIRKLLLLTGLLTAGYFLGTVFPIVHEDLAEATTVKPQPVTELYFEDHTHLPLLPNVKNYYQFAFTIHNREGNGIAYPYVISVQRPGYYEEMQRGTVTVGDRQKKTTLVTVGPVKNLPAKIEVLLLNNHEVISFWIPKS